jgi:8-oxo-dGTP diphosphatase
MAVGRFLAGIGALIWAPDRGAYLLLQRTATKDFAPGAWECVTGRVDQGEGFEDALHREVREELGVAVVVDFILGTTHFYRGAAVPANELLGVVYACTLREPEAIRLSGEHQALRWATPSEALAFLREEHASEAWLKRALVRAERMRTQLSPWLVDRTRAEGAELG